MAILDMTSWLQVYDKHLSVCTDGEHAFRGFFPPCWSISSMYCIHTPVLHTRTRTRARTRARAHTHQCSTNVYIPEIISPYNGKKGSEISSSPPCSSPRLIPLIISSLVPLCAAHSCRETSASWEEVFINISIYCVQKGHKQHILVSSRTNSFNSARKRAGFQHTQLDKRITNSARQADRGS